MLLIHINRNVFFRCLLKEWKNQAFDPASLGSSSGCCSCDFLKMPDWDTGREEVHQIHSRHVQELHDIGVTMLRVDLSLFESVEELSNVLNTVPWDFIYQEWWWEKPDAQRHRYIGHFRDITYRPGHICPASRVRQYRFPFLMSS